MINRIDSKGLRNGEHIQFAADFLQIVQLNNPLSLQVQAEYAALLSINQNIELLFATQTSSPLTEELLLLDGRRSRAINGLLAVINAYSYYFADDGMMAATKLSSHLSLFGTGIARDNYPSKTSTLRKIVEDWTDDVELSAAIATLNLGAWVAELDAANSSFASTYLERTVELAAASPANIKEKRKEATIAYYNLRNRLDAHFMVNNGAEPFAKTINELNALIEQYNTLLTGRKAASK